MKTVGHIWSQYRRSFASGIETNDQINDTRTHTHREREREREREMKADDVDDSCFVRVGSVVGYMQTERERY